MSNAPVPNLPQDHLSHPEQWATGDEPATSKQKGFIKVLEGKNEGLVPEEGIDTAKMGKSEASEVIDKLKNGQPVETNDSTKEDAEVNEPSTPPSKKRSREDTEAEPETTDAGEEQKEPAKEEAKAADDASHDQPKAKAPKVDNNEVTEKETNTSQEKAEEPAANRGETPKPAANGDNSETKEAANGTPNGASTPTLPGDGEHLDHPENWATGDEPATDKQKAFIAVLEKQKEGGVESAKEALGKSEASEKIEELKAE